MIGFSSIRGVQLFYVCGADCGVVVGLLDVVGELDGTCGASWDHACNRKKRHLFHNWPVPDLPTPGLDDVRMFMIVGVL